MEINNFERPDYTFPFIWRGVVEDNNDPEDAGRLKVRIYQIHNKDGNITPISQLPWATPGLGLTWSGGYNINNADYQTATPPPPGPRYDPGANSTPTAATPASPTKFLVEEDDALFNSYGTGGNFVVPKRGNWVYLFFEGGNHMNPVYFAMAPMARDWDTQSKKRNKDIATKISEITDFRKNFTARDQIQAADGSWAPDATVDISPINQPDLLDIPAITEANSNRDITCTTSPQGTTVVFDNRFGKERIYVIHKNFIDYVDETGNKKIFAGSENLETGIAGDYNLFIGGDYRCYTKGSSLFQVDGDAQLDVQGDIGAVSRSGNISVIAEQGNISADIAGNADMNVGANANVQVKNDANVSVGQNLNANVGNNLNATVTGDATVEVNNLNATVKNNALLNVISTLQITCPDVRISGNLSVGGQISAVGDIGTTGNLKVQQVIYSLIGIDTGGYIRNRGPADLGSPVTLHGVIVSGGFATGTGRSPTQASAVAGVPTTPDPAQYEANDSHNR